MDVRGDSMEPLLKDGDTLLVDQSDTEIMDGRIYVVTLGDELRVKRIQKGFKGYVLRSENTRYADITIEGDDLDAFKVHGRVRWVGKML
jgi:phage repressor protein C with HTH and peptisase S24 domain